MKNEKELGSRFGQPGDGGLLGFVFGRSSCMDQNQGLLQGRLQDPGKGLRQPSHRPRGHHSEADRPLHRPHGRGQKAHRTLGGVLLKIMVVKTRHMAD